jgi:hypothetical protein
METVLPESAHEGHLRGCFPVRISPKWQDRRIING